MQLQLPSGVPSQRRNQEKGLVVEMRLAERGVQAPSHGHCLENQTLERHTWLRFREFVRHDPKSATFAMPHLLPC